MNSKEDFGTPVKKTNPYTPESTDLGSEEKAQIEGQSMIQLPVLRNAMKDGRPPSPPDTEFLALITAEEGYTDPDDEIAGG